MAQPKPITDSPIFQQSKLRIHSSTIPYPGKTVRFFDSGKQQIGNAKRSMLDGFHTRLFDGESDTGGPLLTIRNAFRKEGSIGKINIHDAGTWDLYEGAGEELIGLIAEPWTGTWDFYNVFNWKIKDATGKPIGALKSKFRLPYLIPILSSCIFGREAFLEFGGRRVAKFCSRNLSLSLNPKILFHPLPRSEYDVTLLDPNATLTERKFILGAALMMTRNPTL